MGRQGWHIYVADAIEQLGCVLAVVDGGVLLPVSESVSRVFEGGCLCGGIRAGVELGEVDGAANFGGVVAAQQRLCFVVAERLREFLVGSGGL